jgi:Aldehyde dehydrogenase family
VVELPSAATPGKRGSQDGSERALVSGLTPFNFPMVGPCWMFVMAAACGNTFVLRPSERTPSASIRYAELFLEAGMSKGVFNVVHGDKVAVDALIEHRTMEQRPRHSPAIGFALVSSPPEERRRPRGQGRWSNVRVILPRSCPRSFLRHQKTHSNSNSSSTSTIREVPLQSCSCSLSIFGTIGRLRDGARSFCLFVVLVGPPTVQSV